MSIARCTRTPGVSCARQAGHAGVCSACPSAATLDFDNNHEADMKRREDDLTLAALDFDTPHWADLNDPL